MTTGLRTRVIAAFAMFAPLVACLFAATTFVTFHHAEDTVLDGMLGAEVARVEDYLQRHGELPPDTPLVSAFLDPAALPPEVARAVAHLPDGRHEIDITDEEVVVSISSHRDGARLYVVHRQPDLEPDASQAMVIVLGAIGIALAGTLLGIWTARRVTRPLVDLAAVVEHTPPARLPDALAAHPTAAEVSILRDRLVESLRKLESYAEREHHFTRYASHELRTPVAVMRGAAELMRDAPEARAPRIQRPLERIERAAAEMEAIIESLLWLSRERGAPPSPTPVVPLVERALERQRHLVDHKPVAIEIERHGEPEARAPSAAIEIVVGNLLANAFRFTERGRVTVTIGDGVVTVADTGPGMTAAELAAATRPFVRADDSTGAGLGLAIVAALCERFDWTFALDAMPGAGTRAEIRFHSKSNER